MVSVIVMVYNSVNYLDECLQSILAQTYSDYEVMMVDDASTDGSRDICVRYAKRDSRFKLLPFDENRGVRYCRTVTLPQANGELVAVLDSDDRAHPRRLERQVAWFARNTDGVIVGSYYRIISARGRRIATVRLPLHDEQIRWRLWFGNCYAHSSVMFSRGTAIECGGYDPEVLAGEDMEFYSRIISHGSAGVVPEVLVDWRSHQENMGRTEPVKNKRFFVYTVQQSLRRHVGLEIGVDVAEALFNNSTQSAPSAKAFAEALLCVLAAMRVAKKTAAGNRADEKRIARIALAQLMDLCFRNSSQQWFSGSTLKIITVMDAIQRDMRYAWLLDVALLLPGSPVGKRSVMYLLRLTVVARRSRQMKSV